MTPPNHPSIHPPTHTPTIGGGDSTDHKIFEQNKIISISSRFIRTLGSLARGTAISSSILTIFPTRDRIYKGSVGTILEDSIHPRYKEVRSINIDHKLKYLQFNHLANEKIPGDTFLWYCG